MKKIIQQYAKDLTAGRLASGYEHSYRIYHLAREIGEGKDYDDEVLHAACFLHDLELLVDHPEGTSRKAESILGETGFPAEKIPLVTRAILQHMPGSLAETVEGQLLHDANLLDTIGAVGFVRLSIGAFFWRHYKTLEDVSAMLAEELAHADHFFFAESREMAKAKKSFMKTAIEQLGRELEL